MNTSKENGSSSCEQDYEQQRTFLRHPIEIPVEIKKTNKTDIMVTKDISCKGLCYSTNEKLNENDVIEIDINFDKLKFKGSAKVAWCKKQKENYLIGVEFLENTSSFEVKMMQQICQIFKYWKKSNEQGCTFNLEEAAKTWICKNAKKFNQPTQQRKRRI